MSRQQKFVASALIAMAALLVSLREISAEEVLTNASDILALSPDRASLGLKISITGIVTDAEPNWRGRYFVQDASGGVFVNNIDSKPPAPGDLITVTGVSMAGGYAPCIDLPVWKKIGTGPLPPPKIPTIENFMEGKEDSQRIEMTGIVRAASTNYDRLGVQMVAGGYRFRAFAPIPPGIDPRMLVGARVRVRGTAGVSFNRELRHFLTIVIYAPSVSDFSVEEPAAANPFQDPLTSLKGIAQYRNGPSASGRVHVKGVVAFQRPGEDIFLQDATGGLQIKSEEKTIFSPGDVVEAVGFPGVQNFLPVLEDAVFQKTSEPKASVVPSVFAEAELQAGLHNASFITLKGVLLNRLTKGVKSHVNGLTSPQTVLVLQDDTNFVFTAETQGVEEESDLISLPIGSILEVSGICLLQSAEDGKTKSIQLLVPSSQYLRIISKPSWLTQHFLMVLAGAFVVIIMGSTWIAMVLRRNSALRLLIHERELDRKELQKAHDTLEWRVKERTRQLKIQITARKESDLQSKAVLSERTRLAKELHDTIEQTMTGVTLQLNAVAKLLQQTPDTAAHHLGLARSMVRSSRVDLRRSIWDLRSRELEQFDLPTALLISGNQIADGANIRIEVEKKGSVRSLPEIIEENILRVGQEAITNTVKHSGATHLTLELDFSAENVFLTVKDNGNGFTPDNCLGPNNGHFGLLGMTERAKRVGGNILVTSAPGMGTTIRLEVPISETIPVKPANHETHIPEETGYEEDIPDTDSCR